MTLPRWFKSTRSINTNSCVEVAFIPEGVLIRDSKYLRDPQNSPAEQPIICVTVAQWREFLSAVQLFGKYAVANFPYVTNHSDGSVSLSDAVITLTYTAQEWEAFQQGVLTGEFAFTH